MEAYDLANKHKAIRIKFDTLAKKIWNENCLEREYDNDTGLTDAIVCGNFKREFKIFCRRMDKRMNEHGE